MIVPLEELSDWVRVTEEDIPTLQNLVDEAEEELKVTGRTFSETNKLAKQFVKFYVTYWFENRDGTSFDMYQKIKSNMLTKLTYSGDDP